MTKALVPTDHTGQVIELTARAAGGTKDLLVEMIRNPFLAMIAANVAVELLQRIELPTVPESWSYHRQWYPPSHNLIWARDKSPILSQGLATTIETVINTTTALQSVSGSGFLELLGGLLRR